MNFLFVHQNFPGQYLHILRSLLADNEARDGTHQLVFMSEPNRNSIAGVRKVTYARPPSVSAAVHLDAREFEMAARRSQAAYKGALQIKALGFKPDIIIGHHGWGEMLNLVDAFPGVPILGYFEFYYKIHGTDVNYDPEFLMPPERFGPVRGKNCVNYLALGLEQHGQVPTRWQRSIYPDWAQKQLHLIEEGVDLEVCKADPAIRETTLKAGSMTIEPGQKLITYVARNLEPYRGFHTFMRALPKILNARPDVMVSIVGGDEISYGAPHPAGPWRTVMLLELEGQLDLNRITFHGKVPYDMHLNLLKRSDCHVYLSYPFVASWSLREAMAIGCAIVGGDTQTVTEFITHQETGLITPTLDPEALADSILTMLEDTESAATYRANARAFAEKHLDMKDYIARYREVIEEVAGKKILPEVADEVPVKAPAKKTASRKR